MAIKKLASGFWQIDFRDQDGRRHRQSYRLQADARSRLRERQDQVEKRVFVAPKALPAFREIAERWYSDKEAGIGCKGGKIPRPATLWAWRIHLDRHLLPRLGDRRLDQIDTETIERAREELKAGLSPQTVNKVLVTATSVFAMAAKKYKRPNPAADCGRLGITDGEIVDGQTKKRGGTVTEADVLSPKEVGRLLAACGDDLYGTLVAMAIFTGARHDELLALKWANADLAAGKISIRESITWARVKGETYTERWRFYPPKTPAGRRDIRIPPELVSRLKVWKLKCPPSRLDLVFPSSEGNPLPRDHTLRCGLHPLLRRAKLRQVDMHSLRHSFASALILQGTPISEVSYLLGHSKQTTTLSIYSHFFKSMESVSTGATLMLARRLRGGIEKASSAEETAPADDRGHFLDTLEDGNRARNAV